MIEKLTTKNWLKITFLAFLVVFSLGLTTSNALAEVGNAGDDPIADRQNKDKNQTKTEEDKLKELQKEDAKLCEEEAEEEEDPQSRIDDFDWLNPNGDWDHDSIPNSQDNDSNNDGTPDTKPMGPISPACQDGDTAGYIAANEGIHHEVYNDVGKPAVGVGHDITGNEPADITEAINSGTPLTDEQVERLYDSDMTTAKNCARQTATDHGVNYDQLSPERQTVLVDMSYNMGCGGGGGVAGFDNMWGNIADAQRTGSQESWDAAGDEIEDSTYGSQLPRRSGTNADIMRTSDSSKIDGVISSDQEAQNFCSETATVWKNPFSLFASLLKSQIARAATTGQYSQYTGQYVPVQEQGGELMDYTEGIESNTDKIRTLSIQICTHLRAIKRIQQRFEQKMVEDANLKRVKSTELENYRQAMFGESGITKKKGARINEEGEEVSDEPLYVLNNKTYVQNASDEGAQIALDNLIQNNSSNNTSVIAALNTENSFDGSGPSIEDVQNVLGIEAQAEPNSPTVRGPLDNIPILSTILRPVRNSLAWISGNSAWAAPSDPPANNKIVDSDRFWNSFLTVVRTNPGAAYLQAVGNIEQERNMAVTSARDTAAQGQGFLPVKTCLAKTKDGKTCTTWAIRQPGIIVKETDATAINSRINEYIQAKEMGDITKGNEPNITEIITNTPSPTGGGAPGPGMTDPGNISSETSHLQSDDSTNNTDDNGNGDNNSHGDGGEGGDNGDGGNSWDSIADLIDNLFGGSDNPDLESNPLLQLLLQLIQGLFNKAEPWVIFKAKDKGDNISLVYWYSPNASSNCKTNNKWIEWNEEGTATTTVKESGVNINKSGSQRVRIASGESETYKIKCTNANGDTERILDLSKN